MMDSIVNSLWRHFTDPHAACHNLRLCPKEYKVRDLNQEIKQILSNKPDKEWEKPTARKVLKALHISDLHPDLYYTVGAPGKCGEPVCCRSNVTLKLSFREALARIERGEHLEVDPSSDSPAGYWGSLNSCDLPIQTFHLFLKEIAEINPDLIIWTGDNTPHDIWQQSQSYNLNFTVMLTEKMAKAAPRAKIIAAMGNHESFPVNVYDYEGEREKMLIGGLAEAWKPWLTKEAYDMLREKGYYAVTIPEFNNLKVISVNTQAQNDQNWFNLRNPTDPGSMLKWIEAELKASEAAGQLVYIIGHIPPASAMNDWAMRFNALTERYSYNIRGQFYGHTHRDHVGFFPSFADKERLAAYYLISPSLTTYSDKHPEYRVMSLDYDTLQVLDYEQYRLDLTKFRAKEDSAKFELFYRFRDAYKLEDMTIRGGMSQLKSRLQTDNETQIKYTYLKSSGTEKGHAGKDVYCDTMPSPQWSAECNGGTFKPSSFEKVAGKWRDLQHKQ
jgi:sphingomyelin phosphodiesterase